MKKLRILELRGTPFEMGYQHGQAFREDIRLITENRIRLCCDPYMTGKHMAREEVLAQADACVAEHRLYAPALMEELEGMAAATNLSLAELIVVNGFTDFVDVLYNAGTAEPLLQPLTMASDNCTAFIVPDQAAADGHGFCGQTWDMHYEATPYVTMLRICHEDSPKALLFTITGCVGMIGMNDAGIAIGINNLMGGDGQAGVTWPFVIRRALEQTTVTGALACITDALLAGAHNYVLFDSNGRGFNVEAMSTHYHVEEVEADCLVHTNHCLVPETISRERARPPESIASSKARLDRARDLLIQGPVTPESLQALTRDEQAVCVKAQPPFFTETCGAALMRPATGDFWAVWGLPTENEFEHLVV